MFHFNVPDNDNDVKANVTTPTFVTPRVGMLHITTPHKDTLQVRRIILMSFRYAFISIYVHQQSVTYTEI